MSAKLLKGRYTATDRHFFVGDVRYLDPKPVAKLEKL